MVLRGHLEIQTLLPMGDALERNATTSLVLWMLREKAPTDVAMSRTPSSINWVSACP